MERKGAAYRITATRPGGGDPAPRVTSLPWVNGSADDDERGMDMSIQRHPSGGHTASVLRRDSRNPESTAGDVYTAGPFRDPARAQQAAEALGNRVASGGGSRHFRERRY